MLDNTCPFRMIPQSSSSMIRSRTIIKMNDAALTKVVKVNLQNFAATKDGH